MDKKLLFKGRWKVDKEAVSARIPTTVADWIRKNSEALNISPSLMISFYLEKAYERSKSAKD